MEVGDGAVRLEIEFDEQLEAILAIELTLWIKHCLQFVINYPAQCVIGLHRKSRCFHSSHIILISRFFHNQMEVGEQELSLMRSKLDAMKDKLTLPFTLCREYMPLDLPVFQLQFEKLISVLTIAPEQQSQEISFDEYAPIILGVLQGSSAVQQAASLLEKRAECSIPNISRLENFIKEKVKISFYGAGNDKRSAVREIKDGKVLDGLAAFFDLKEIKSHRKLCGLFKSYQKSTKKFVESMPKLDQANTVDTYSLFIKALDDQRKYNEAKKSILYKNSSSIAVSQIVPTNQNAQKQKQQNKQGLQVNPNEMQCEEIKEPAKVQDAQKPMIDELQLTPTKTKKKGKKSKKDNTNSTDGIESDISQKTEKPEKKQEKKPMRSLFDMNFLTKQKNGSPKKDIIEQLPGQQNSISFEKLTPQQSLNAFLRYLSQPIPMSSIRQQILQQLLSKNTDKVPQPCYANIIIKKSTLEFINYFIPMDTGIRYDSPHDEFLDMKYADDSSQEYEQLCGQVCDQIEEQEEEEENQSANGTIVPDGYLSGQEISSLEDSRDQIKVEISRGGEWAMLVPNPFHQRAGKYKMECLQQFLKPLPMTQEIEPANALSPALKLQLYRQMHGFVGSKEFLIKKLTSITDKFSKNFLDNLIKQTTMKVKGSQRLVKKQIIEELSEEIEGVQSVLQEIKQQRDRQMEQTQRSRQTQKQQKMQALILEYNGDCYITNLVKHLRQNGFRLTKRQLSSFIEQKSGQKWDQIKKMLVKMRLKNKTLEEFKGKKRAKYQQDGDEKQKMEPQKEACAMDQE